MVTSKINSRWLPYILGVSLGLNLMVVAGVTGALFLRGDGPDRMRGAGFAGPYILALPQEDRQALRRQSRAQDGRREARKAQYGMMIDTLRADPFDRDATAAVLMAQQAAVVDRQDRLRAAWLDLVAAMDAAQRAQYVERLEQIIARRRDHSGR